MGMKVRKKKGDREKRTRRKKRSSEDHVEVGMGDFCVMTINRHDGSTVVQRFATREEARAQHNRNIAHDAPLVGVSEAN
ncbi:MAG: hypothetical protein ACQEVA_11650 [Myxococcota bacterium]